jgi:CRP-like cAMP-binding protein
MSTRRFRPVNCQDCAIRETCALNRLRNEERARIEPQIRERIFHRGDVLLEEEKTAKAVRFLKLGTVFGYRTGLDGRSRPIGVVRRGGALGIFGTFAMPSQATCVALTTVRVCEVPVAGVRDMMTCGSGLLVQISRSATEMFAAVIAWSEVMRLPGVVNQLAYVLVLLADASQAPVVQLPSHAALAELLGTRRESIARALRVLESEGGIRRHERKRCEVRRSQLLMRLSPGG